MTVPWLLVYCSVLSVRTTASWIPHCPPLHPCAVPQCNFGKGQNRRPWKQRQTHHICNGADASLALATTRSWMASAATGTNGMQSQKDSDVEDGGDDSDIRAAGSEGAVAESMDTGMMQDYDGIGRLFVLPTESGMLRYVTDYLKKDQADEEMSMDETGDFGGDKGRATTATMWSIPKSTIVSADTWAEDDSNEKKDAEKRDTGVSVAGDDAKSTNSTRSSSLLQSRLERENLANKKAKSLLDSNPIFERYRNGTLNAMFENTTDPSLRHVTTSAATGAGTEATTILPTFPSREHCVGFWCMIQSPTGFAVEQSTSSDNDMRSDNLILRVDGTIAGGPILDQEFRHKASGGQWDIVKDDMVAETSFENCSAATLRVSLIIPPAKNRMLLLEGTLEQLDSSNGQSSSENIIQCSGSVWIKDVSDAGLLTATTSSLDRRRNDASMIGSFVMQKLAPPADRQSYTITVPRNVRPID